MPVSSLSEKAPPYGWWTADMQAELSVDNNETSARMVKARLEKTVLGQVTAHIKAVLQPAAGFISIRLDLEVIAKLQLSVTPQSVGMALLKQSKLKLKTDNIRCVLSPANIMHNLEECMLDGNINMCVPVHVVNLHWPACPAC